MIHWLFGAWLRFRASMGPGACEAHSPEGEVGVAGWQPHPQPVVAAAAALALD